MISATGFSAEYDVEPRERDRDNDRRKGRFYCRPECYPRFLSELEQY
jgi:hypothetical protein